jgi:hypothetical protein
VHAVEFGVHTVALRKRAATFGVHTVAFVGYNARSCQDVDALQQYATSLRLDVGPLQANVKKLQPHETRLHQHVDALHRGHIPKRPRQTSVHDEAQGKTARGLGSTRDRQP